MKKILTTLAISLSVLSFSPSSMAHAPPATTSHLTEGIEVAEERDLRQDQRRSREDLGVQRLKQHKWQQGYVMPQHYRANRYKVDYHEHDLPKPNRQQQWYKINNDYVLINSNNHSILQIKNF